MAEFEPRFEIDPELVPIQGFNQLFQHVSPPRQVMMGGNLAQSNVIKGATRKRQRSALERSHAKGTFMQKFDFDAYVVAVIPRFVNMGYNPMDLVIIQNTDGQYDCIEMPKHKVLHQHYGYEFKRREPAMDLLRPNARIPQGTILATSPNVTDDGDYMPGAEVNVINLNVPGVAEDGLILSATMAGRITQTTGIESRILSFGQKQYPINVNGNESQYLVLPEIGQTIRSDGIITALRPKDKFHDPVYMSKRKLMRPVYGMDDPVYGKPNAKVIDIKVWYNETGRSSRLPPEMTEQLRRYHEADKEYYRTILETVMRHSGQKLMSRDVNLSSRLWIIIDQAIKYLGVDLVEYGLWERKDIDRLKAPRLWRGQPMDEWRVEITFSYNTKSAIGPKATDLSGNTPIQH